jgi:hypothetical protein
MAVPGVGNEKVGRTLIDGSAVANGTVERKAMVGKGTAVVVGGTVGVTRTEVAGREVGVSGIFSDAHPNKITVPNR